ncbi:MAG: hypothetical protein NVSMB56_05650 [Pyrinomonadaceae bacterium]
MKKLFPISFVFLALFTIAFNAKADTINLTPTTTSNGSGSFASNFSSSWTGGAIVLTPDGSFMQNSTTTGFSVPESATIGLLAIGMTGFSAYARRRNKPKNGEDEKNS